ncbi:MAG: cytochrome c [Gemmataceae bacterium]|nr:cytochrome c [Gemmataceae bacterium]
MRRLLMAALAGAMLLASGGTAQTVKSPAPKFVPKFEVVAETKLLMEGLAHSNYRSLDKLLRTKAPDNETWAFARGQAILVAETGNLLLLRPPKGAARDTWMKLAMDMRAQATTLARAAAARDHAGSKQELARLGDACTRCHTTFRIPVRIAPQAETARDVSLERGKE